MRGISDRWRWEPTSWYTDEAESQSEYVDSERPAVRPWVSTTRFQFVMHRDQLLGEAMVSSLGENHVPRVECVSDGEVRSL